VCAEWTDEVHETHLEVGVEGLLVPLLYSFFFKSLFLFFLYIYTYIYYSFPSFSMYEPLCALYDQLPKRAGIQILAEKMASTTQGTNVKFAKLHTLFNRRKGKKKYKEKTN